MDPLTEKLVKGKGAFIDDLSLPGLLYLKIVRSPYARARITRVKGGLTHAEFPAVLASVGEGAMGGSSRVPFPALADSFVNYVGQPVAAVYADNPYKAEDEAESVEVEYEPLTPVMDPLKALDSPPIHQGLSANVLSSEVLGSKFEVAGSEVVVEQDLAMPRVAANPIETRGVIASPQNGRLTVYASTQSAHSVKRGLCESLRLDPSMVRVIQADTGGAFGSKGGMYPEYAIASYLALKTNQPVKWIESRAEHISASPHGRGAYSHMKVYANRKGRVLGLEARIVVDGGAYYNGFNAFSPSFIGFQATGPYAIPKAHVEVYSVYTNKPPLGPYRGAGRPEAAFFIERMMDILADELSLDPLDVRLENASYTDFVSPTGLRVPASRSFIERAAGKLGYNRGDSSTPAGFSAFVLVPAAQPGEGARIAVKAGRVKVWLGGNSHGQRHDVFIKKLVSEELGLDPGLIDVQMGDTDELKQGVGSWGSRTAIVGGAAVVEAARKLKQEASESVGSTGGPGYTPENLLKMDFDVTVFRQQTEPLISLGANLVTAKVGSDGLVQVVECRSYYDVGRALNPWMVEAQISGGAAQAIGQTLFEEVKYTSSGELLTYSILDAGVPSSTSMPRYVSMYEENGSNLPHGAKGLGESPTIGVPPALARAIEKASGKRITSTPVTPERLLT